jgi:hypothetical protein
MACHLQIDADPDPAYHFDADQDADFYLMRCGIICAVVFTVGPEKKNMS